jgi:polyvinyl alcohol dehydrogenase (cytochrome)
LKIIWLGLIILFLLPNLIIAHSQAVGNINNWTSFTLNNNNSRYQANFTINSFNIGNIVEKWQINTGTGIVTSTPIVNNGNVYFTDWNGSVYSANVLTGSPNWKANVGQTISSTLLIANGIVYVGYGLSGPISVMAINEYKGKEIWHSILSPEPKQKEIWASPIFYNGLLYIGATGLEDTNSSTSGGIYALNAQTGTLVWNFSTSKGSAAGDGVWGSIVVDPNLNSVYFGTGNPYLNESYPNTLYGYAIMSLNATNGKLVWYKQVYTNYSEGQDNDFGSTPNLFSMTVNGITYNAIGLGNKNGKYYILDRDNGSFIKNYTIEHYTLYTGVIGLPGFVYQSNSSNPELFIPSFYHPESLAGINGIVEAVYPSNNYIPWRFYTPGAMIGSVSEVPGTVLFGDNFSNFYAVNILTGNSLFTDNFNSEILAGITPADGFILIPLAGFAPGQKSGIVAFTTPANITKTNLTVWNASNWPTTSLILSNATFTCYLVSKDYIDVNSSWCQNGTTLYQSNETGWKTLIINNTNYSDFEIDMKENIISGNNFKILMDYNPTTGDFYSLTLSKNFNTITFDIWKNWTRINYIKLATDQNETNKIGVISYNNTFSVLLNNKTIAVINNTYISGISNTTYSSGKLAIATESSSVIISNLSVYSYATPPKILGNFQTSDLVLLFSFFTIFVLMAILSKEKGEKLKNILLDTITVIIIILPILIFLLLGNFPGIFFILYVIYLYIIYFIYTKKFKFYTKNLENRLLFVYAILVIQLIIALFDYYIVQSFKGSELLYLSGTYQNLLFYKFEPIIWLLFAFMYFLGNRKELGNSIKIFILGIFITFSPIEDFLYYFLSGTKLPTQFPWITTASSLLGNPLTQTKLVVWLILILGLSVLIILFPIDDLFKKAHKTEK